jgi:primosomal protein N' (replication factor Y) (superfamily II helicase)
VKSGDEGATLPLPLPVDAERAPAVEPAPDRYVSVALPVPLRRTFTYRVAADRELPPIGARVAVPFSGRKLPGIVVAHPSEKPEGVDRIKNVAGLLDGEPVFGAELLQFLMEAADYYLHPVGEVMRAAAPAMPSEAMRALRAGGFLERGESLKGASVATRKTVFVRRATDADPPRLGPHQRTVMALLAERSEISADELRDHVASPRTVLRALEKRGLVVLEEREVAADPFFSADAPADASLELNADQSRALAALIAALDRGASTHLVHGVTGSGKTEVYLRTIEAARARGKGALLLVPEIALTPQLVSRFRARFGDGIAVLHSGLTDKQRTEAWRGLRRGELRLAIGARSALFAPVPDLGVIVVDEEHDPSFKQEEGFRYQARDLAILRAHRAGALCILGSATPSLESYYRAKEGQIALSTLPSRATAHALPRVEIVDLRRHGAGPSGHPLLTLPMHRALERCLAGGGQAILFLNRRGFSPSHRCGACGEIAQCPACSVALTEHRRAKVLRCHYCDFTTPFTLQCPLCKEHALEPIGLGTERLEDTLADVFAPARVARLDRDTAAGGRAIESVLDRLRRREVDILVGTQMVTKGHDIAGVTLVGVVLADQSLAFPDFRAAERTFQLLTQVAGRAGRGDRAGEVVIQTFQPTKPSIVHARAHDYLAFYADELEARRELLYPPFGRLIAVRVDAGDEMRARDAAIELARIAQQQPAVQAGKVEVLPATAAPIARLRARWRFRLFLRGRDRPALRSVALAIVRRIDEGLGSARAHVDVDPVSML